MAKHDRAFAGLVFSDKHQPKHNNPIHFSNQVFKDVVYSIFERNPTYTVMVTDSRGGHMPDERFVIRAMVVYSKGEKLGHISDSYKRGNYGVDISSSYVPNGSTFTSDSKRAATLAKKYLLPKTRADKIKEAAVKAGGVISNVAHNHNSALQQTIRNLRELAYNYVMGEGRTGFEQNLARTQNLQMLEKHGEQQDRVNTIEHIKSLYGTDKTALVILDAGQYVVKIGEYVNLYNDSTFPHTMRGKLGMLKLVENGQMISDVGCKVNAETFVLVVDEEPNNVSQGETV